MTQVLDIKLRVYTHSDDPKTTHAVAVYYEVFEPFEFWNPAYNKESIKLYVLCEDSVKEYNETLEELKVIAKEMGRSKNPDGWIMYFNMLKWQDDVSYNYAITAHKSQGSTYTNVLLLEEDLNKNPRTVERNRIKYTAYTRASNRVYTVR